MNLLIIAGYWPTDANPISGIFVVVQQVAALAKQGCRVTVVLGKTIGKRKYSALISRLS